MFNYLETIMGGVTSGDRAVKQFNSVPAVVTAVANLFIIVGFGLVIISIAISFIQFAISTGDKDATDRAKNTLSWGGIGALVVLGAFTIKNIILKLLGVSGGVL